MYTFTLETRESVTTLMNLTHSLEKGLIVVAGSDANWVDFVLFGLLGSYQAGNRTVISKNNPPDIFYYTHLVVNQAHKADDKIVNFYGTVGDSETLEQVFESAKDTVVICVLRVTSPTAVELRLQDLLAASGKNFSDYEHLIACVVSSEESSGSGE